MFQFQKELSRKIIAFWVILAVLISVVALVLLVTTLSSAISSGIDGTVLVRGIIVLVLFGLSLLCKRFADRAISLYQQNEAYEFDQCEDSRVTGNSPYQTITKEDDEEVFETADGVIMTPFAPQHKRRRR